jgi:hypothetical protein
VIRIDPAIVAPMDPAVTRKGNVFPVPRSSSEDVRVGFGS